ncbi:MAG: Mov34/MPN/PAD-1 family protein [Armatimonadota bacterium]|nr:Mov34/MPN/PAD-1 family protein [Armatimonadota bacterium]
MKPFVEEAHILTGERRGRVWLMRRHHHVAGQPICVEADWRWALERDEQRDDVVGFLHTHPPGAGTAPSPRDVRTMRAWCSALGKPLLCVIQCRNRIESTLFLNDEDDGRPLSITERFARDVLVAVEGSEDDHFSP